MGVYWTFVVLLVSGCAFAAWRGGRTEHLVALTMAIAFGATQLGRLPAGMRYLSVNGLTVAIDCLMLGALLWIMLRSPRRWPITLVSLQAILVLAHVVRAVEPRYIALTYAIMTMTWPFIQVALLIYGAATSRRRSATI